MGQVGAPPRPPSRGGGSRGGDAARGGVGERSYLFSAPRRGKSETEVRGGTFPPSRHGRRRWDLKFAVLAPESRNVLRNLKGSVCGQG